MQRSTKQFCWVYHLQKSQLKMTLFVAAVLLRVFGSSNIFPMQIWDSFLTRNHLSCKHSQTLPFFGAIWWIYLFQQLFEFFWRESFTFKMGKKYIRMAAIVNRFRYIFGLIWYWRSNITQFWFSKSIFYVKNQPNHYDFFFIEE